MLCVRKLTFVDRAETEELWTYNLKKQWSMGEMLAVRVHDASERMLGSTIPVPLASPEAGQTEAGVSWIDEDPADEPQVAGEGGEAEPEVVPAEPHSAGENPPKASSGPAEDADAPQEQEAPKPEGTRQSPTAPQPTDRPSNSAAAEQLPPTDDASTPVHAATSDKAEASPEVPTAGSLDAAAAPPKASSPTSPNEPADVAALLAPMVAFSDGEDREAPSASAAAASPSEPAPQLATRRRTFSNCIPINVSQAAKGPLLFEVITLLGTKLAVAEVNVQAALDASRDGTPRVQHYAIVVTPLKAKPKELGSTVHAVLEYSVVTGSTDVDTITAMAASAQLTSLPTTLNAGDTCALSTRTFYFPPTFLTGTGEYIVTNVLCVESLSDNPVRLEVALPEDLKRIGVLPDKKVVISHKGERAFFTFTWNVFDAYVAISDDKDADADNTPAGLHLLIRDGAENKAPVDITLVGDVPSPATDNVGPYMFYVNHARVTNLACNAANEVILADILPISLVTRASV